MMLSELIEFLGKRDSSTAVPLGFGRPHSYRGFYDSVAFEPVRNTTVGDMLIAAQEALGSTYSGYKGGNFTMGPYTDVYLANWGDCGEEIGPVLLSFMVGEGGDDAKAE